MEGEEFIANIKTDWVTSLQLVAQSLQKISALYVEQKVNAEPI